MPKDNSIKLFDSYWQDIIPKAVEQWGTPFYIFSWLFVEKSLAELSRLNIGLPLRHWLSFKTQPVRPLIKKWEETGRDIEVVSKFELLSALKEGYIPERILVNGVAKHNWLYGMNIHGLRVHFDSLLEIYSLKKQAINNNWRIGIRFHVNEEYDPDEPDHGGQFGIQKEDALIAVSELTKSGLDVESVHFHLRPNIHDPESYKNALIELSEICQLSRITPIFIDCGGGLPVEGERSYFNQNHFRAFNFKDFNDALSITPTLFPNAKELWLENGRFITARMGVLVIRVIDIKERGDSRYLICDGGRTNHALVSDWEAHDILIMPERKGKGCLTTVCGPTCMAFDRLIREVLSTEVQVGDLIVWKNAGAYHIPWETRFSHGLARVLWCDENGEISLARDEETFTQWWNQWL